MNKILFFFFLLFLNLFAEEKFLFENLKDNQNLTAFTYYVKDKNNNLVAKNILQNDVKLEKLKTSYVGLSKKPFWTKVTLFNETKHTQKLFFYNSRTRQSIIDIYVYKNNKLIQRYKQGDFRSLESRENRIRYSNFELILKPKEEYTVITYIENYNIYTLSWDITNKEEFLQIEMKRLFAWGLVGGGVILFFFFNIFMYRVHKQLGYLIIGTHALFFMTFQYIMNGIAYMFGVDMYSNYVFTLFFLSVYMFIFLALLFPYYFFHINENYKKLAFAFKILGALSLLIPLGIVYSIYVENSFFPYVTAFIFIVSLINYLFLIGVGFYMYEKKEIGSTYYILGQGFYAISFIIYIAALAKVLPFNIFTKNLLLFALIVDIVFLILAQYFRTKKEQENLLASKELLMEQSRFSSIGQTIGNITHQWKYPLAQLGSCITLIEATYKHKKENILPTLDEKLPLLNSSIKLMQNTLDEFSGFYTTKLSKDKFNVYKCVKDIVEMLKSKIMLVNVEVEIDINDAMYIKGYEYIFSNLMIILIDNSLNAFSKKEDNFIKISVRKKESRVSIYYVDNAGGIDIKPIEKIFAYSVSSNKDKHNQGMGLPIAKMLVEEKLNGKISVSNVSDGVSFYINMSMK